MLMFFAAAVRTHLASKSSPLRGAITFIGAKVDSGQGKAVTSSDLALLQKAFSKAVKTDFRRWFSHLP